MCIQKMWTEWDRKQFLKNGINKELIDATFFVHGKVYRSGYYCSISRKPVVSLVVYRDSANGWNDRADHLLEWDAIKAYREGSLLEWVETTIAIDKIKA